MMIISDAEVAKKLEDLIDQNGPDYLAAEPYKVHKELIASGVNKRISGAILYALVNGAPDDLKAVGNFDDLSKRIRQEYGLNKGMSDRLASIFRSLYSEDHIQEWKNREQKGLTQFLSEEFTCTWEGFAVWNEGNGSVDCHYKAEIVLEPTDKVADNKGLVQMLKKNPFTTKDVISKYFTESLCKYLDSEFEKDCISDDYYQPVVEDFEAEYCVKEWSRKNGFDFISCDGDGYDDGYEPNFRRGWY